MIAKIAKWFILAWTLLCLLWFCAGVSKSAERRKDLEGDARTAHDVGTGIGMGLVSVAWVIPTFGATLIYLVFRRKRIEVEIVEKAKHGSGPRKSGTFGR